MRRRVVWRRQAVKSYFKGKLTFKAPLITIADNSLLFIYLFIFPSIYGLIFQADDEMSCLVSQKNDNNSNNALVRRLLQF